MPGCITNAVATGWSDHDEDFYGNPVSVTTHYIIDNQCSGSSSHYFYLNVTNLNTTQTDDAELGLAYPAGPQSGGGTLNAQVDGSVGNRIRIYINVSVTHGMSFDDDDKTWTITLRTP